jgi:polygalacturonase
MTPRKLYNTCIFFVITQFAVASHDYNILSFGAVPDGKTLNTKAIQAAINLAHKEGGGRVIIPAGRFLSGSIVLRSNVELHLLKQAVLLGSVNPDDYLKMNRWKALVMADSANNISISGKGVLDGQGAQLALTIDSLFYAGKIDSSDYELNEKRPTCHLRPQIIEFLNCNNIRVTGVTIKNAACWVQTYELCRNLIIDNIKVESDAYWNNDGIDISNCKNVQITHSSINSSDDGICLKSYCKNPKIESEYCDSIYISDCTVRSSASAIKLGTPSCGGFKNITIENIKIFDTFRSAIALELVDDGVMENIMINNITAKNTGNAIFIRLGDRRKQEPVGQIKNITIKNVKVKVPFERADYAYEIRGPELPYFHNIFPSSITGIPEQPIENIHLENIEIIYPGGGNPAYANMPLWRLKDVPEMKDKYPEFSMFGELPAWGMYVRHVKGLTLKNIKIKIEKRDYRPALVFDDVKNLSIESLKIEGDKKKELIIFNSVEELKIIK